LGLVGGRRSIERFFAVDSVPLLSEQQSLLLELVAQVLHFDPYLIILANDRIKAFPDLHGAFVGSLLQQFVELLKSFLQVLELTLELSNHILLLSDFFGSLDDGEVDLVGHSEVGLDGPSEFVLLFLQKFVLGVQDYIFLALLLEEQYFLF